MNLPQLEEKSIIEVEICGYKINIRKAKIEDTGLLSDINKKGLIGLDSNVYAIAYLMDGYDEDFETRLKWLNSLNLTSFSDIEKLSAIISEVGLQPETKGNSKKK